MEREREREIEMWCNVGWDGGGDGGCKVWAQRERNEREAG